jgi:hypothetical protein
MATSPAREELRVRLSLDAETRRALEKIAEQDRRSISSAASLLLEASLRARQGVSEGAAHG